MTNLKGYLTVVGYVVNATQVTWRLGYLSAIDDPTMDTRLKAAELPPVIAAQYDANATKIASTAIPAGELHVHSPNAEAYLFLGKLPLDATTTKIILSAQDKELAEFVLPTKPPVIDVTWNGPSAPTGKQVITWVAEHPENAPMEYMLWYSNDGGQKYQQVSQSISAQSYPVDFDVLPGGKGQIMVQATDGANTTAAHSPTFDLPLRPAHTMILAPADKATVSGQLVTFLGQGYFLEEDKPELTDLTWSSSRDGMLGAGQLIQSKLSPGEHTITLVTGQGSRQGTATITLIVR